MRKTFLLFVPAFAVVLASALLVIDPLSAQEAGSSAAGPSPEAGLFFLQGGALSGVLAVTQTNPTTIPKSSSWAALPNATHSWSVPPGTTLLFNVSFSAECMLNNAAGGDVLRIRVLDNGVPMEPSDGQQQFCSIPGTYTGEWTKRVSTGAHTVTAQFLVVDQAPLGNVSALIDDWAFVLKVHQ